MILSVSTTPKPYTKYYCRQHKNTFSRPG